MKRFFVVDSDCLGITKRLKEIDSDYFLVLNLDSGFYELFCNRGLFAEHCLTFPYKEIDERMIDLALKTRVQNSDALFEEMERQNRENEKKIMSATLNTFKESLYES